MKSTGWILFAAITAKDGAVPEWVLLFKAGWVEVEGEGKFLVDQEAYKLLAKYVERRGIDLVFDYEHQSLGEGKAPAAGWITEIRWEDGKGIMAHVKWTEEAAGSIRKGEYRYFSPVFLVRKSDKRLAAVHSVALTNTPKTNHLTPILAKLELENNLNRKEEEAMEFLKKLIAKLGLSDDAQESDVLNAIGVIQDKKPEVKEVVAKEVLAALDMTEGDASVVVASIHALKQAGKGAVSREEFEAMQKKLREKDAIEVVAKAMAAGKLTPDQKEWAKEYAERDLAGFTTFVSKAPVVVPVEKLPGKKTEIDDFIADETTLKVAKMFGNSEEDLKKYGT